VDERLVNEPWKKSGPFGDDDLEFLRSYSEYSTPRRAADEIVRLRRSKEALVEIVKRHADTIAELRWQVEAFRKATAEHDCSLTKGSPDD